MGREGPWLMPTFLIFSLDRSSNRNWVIEARPRKELNNLKTLQDVSKVQDDKAVN